MKNIFKIFILFTFFSIYSNSICFAKSGDLGYFGGITEGSKLPSSTELLLANTLSKTKNKSTQMVYKEMIFLNGTPTVFEGLLTVKSTDNSQEKDYGTYTVTYNVESSDTTVEGVSIDRTIVFNVNFRKEERQIIKDYSIKSWSEAIKVNGSTYTIDPKQSNFTISILEDHTAGVNYYSGNISKYAVYKGNDKNSKTIEETSGDIYGYESAWSSTETHRVDGIVYDKDWEMQYQVRPSVGVNKTLQFAKNEPTAISYMGNYKEVMQNESGLQYNIFAKPKQFSSIEDEGSIDIQSFNTFEQLIAPKLDYLRGHFAEEDIKKLFSMQILDGDPKHFSPDQSITRSQFVMALVKAVKIPVNIPTEKEKAKKTKKNKGPITLIFPDVTDDRKDYPFIVAAYENGIAIGTNTGYFSADKPIEREEAVALILRVLGLESLGLDPTPLTSFVDDADISNWAKQEIYAANRIGLIRADNDGNLNPKTQISKAEAAALINRLISYMRQELKTDYSENIVNYAN